MLGHLGDRVGKGDRLQMLVGPSDSIPRRGALALIVLDPSCTARTASVDGGMRGCMRRVTAGGNADRHVFHGAVFCLAYSRDRLKLLRSGLARCLTYRQIRRRCDNRLSASRGHSVTSGGGRTGTRTGTRLVSICGVTVHCSIASKLRTIRLHSFAHSVRARVARGLLSTVVRRR